MNRNVNPAIPESMQAYELMCREAADRNEWEALFRIDDAGTLDERALTRAFVIRSYMKQLKALGLLDDIFTRFCALLSERNELSLFQQYLNLFLSDNHCFKEIAVYTGSFLILRPDETCGGVLMRFADDLAKSLEELGQSVIVIGNGQESTDFDSLRLKEWKGIIGFQAPALEHSFFKEIDCPKYQFWFDNPLQFDDMLQNLSDDYYILSQDGHYAELIRHYYHANNAIRFFPGGIMQPYGNDGRTNDLIFVGNCFEDNGDELSGFAAEFYRFMLSHPCMTFDEALLRLRPELANDDMAFVRTMRTLKKACASVRSHFRRKVVGVLLDAGISVHVYGEEWRDYSWKGQKNPAGLCIHPRVSVDESLGEWRRARIALNVMSWHKDGMTERVANIMLAGALCLSEETAYMKKHIKDGEEAVFFRLDELEGLPGKVCRLLKDEDERERIAHNGYLKAFGEFTWRERAKELVALSEAYVTENEQESLADRDF